KGQIVRLAHVEIEIDGIERDQRRQQGGRAGGCPAASDQAADRHLAGADPSGEWRRDVAIFEVELGVPDACLGILDRGLRGVLFVGALVDRLLCAEVAAPERLRTHELAVRECKACNRRLQLGLRLGQLDFVRAWIDDEEKIALMDDLAVLEMDFRERPAYLRAQLDAVDCGKLTKESKPRVDIALQRPAYRDGRHDGLWCCRLTVPVVRGAKVS